MQSATKTFQLQVLGGHTYVITSAVEVVGNNSILVTGSVDGVPCSVSIVRSDVLQAFQNGGIPAVENLVAPDMLAAVFLPAVLVHLGTFSQ